MGTAAFLILGNTCTRHCRFCAVVTAGAGLPPREDEPEELALAVQELALNYAVLTSVDRDDLDDRGADHFARCIGAIKQENPACRVEVLIPDYCGTELAPVIKAAPDVIAHNVETVRSLQKTIRDSRASFDKSLMTLREAKAGGIMTKSSILLGFGEREEELLSAMDELRSVGVDILVLGQYLQPSKKQIPVAEYISPGTFDRLGKAALERGFMSVVSSPLARTSYHAGLQI
jgi:lipoic acid synthetase